MSAPGRLVLLVIAGPSRGRGLELTGGRYVVGRDAASDLVLVDPRVSRRHLELSVDGSGLSVKNLSSSASLRVDGARTASAHVEPGAVIEIGGSRLRVESSDPAPQRVRVGDVTIIGGASLDGNASPFARSRSRQRTAAGEEKSDAAALTGLHQASRALTTATDEDELWLALVDGIVEAVQADEALVLVARGGSGRGDPLTWTPRSWSARETRRRSGAPGGWSSTVATLALRRQQAILCEDVPSEPELSAARSVIANRLQSAMAAPIVGGPGEQFFVYAHRTGDGASFSATDLGLLAALAQQAGGLLERVRDGMRRRQNENRNAAARKRDARMTATTPSMKRAMDFLERVAATDVTVLVRGESGTGKELAAALVHSSSPRAAGPMVAVNCAALAPSLIESELFGHVKGAFTGADTARDGRFVEADGGTLFLDEIGEMELASQAKLLRALETRTVTPVGGGRPRAVDVRIVAGTNRDLEEAVTAGQFRSDLYYRLRVAEVMLPPLRERRADILPLAERFIDEFNVRLGRRIDGLEPDVRRILEAHDWPGNVRELRNAIELAMILTKGPRITPDDLSILRARMRPERVERPIDAVPVEPGVFAAGADLRPLDDVIIEHVVRVLARVQGNKALAARKLGIDRKTLYSYLSRSSSRLRKS